MWSYLGGDHELISRCKGSESHKWRLKSIIPWGLLTLFLLEFAVPKSVFLHSGEATIQIPKNYYTESITYEQS